MASKSSASSQPEITSAMARLDLSNIPELISREKFLEFVDSGVDDPEDFFCKPLSKALEVKVQRGQKSISPSLSKSKRTRPKIVSASKISGSKQSVVSSVPESTCSTINTEQSQIRPSFKFESTQVWKHTLAKLTPKCFSASKSDDAEDWLASIKRYSTINEISWPHLKVFIPCYLRGYPADWFELNQSQFTSFKYFERQFITTFSPEISDVALTIKFNTTYQEPSESMTHFVTQLTTIARKLSRPCSDREIIKMVLKHSLPRFQALLFSRQPQTLFELLAVCSEIESTIVPEPKVNFNSFDSYTLNNGTKKKTKVFTNRTKNKKTTSTEKCGLCHQVGHTNKTCYTRLHKSSNAEDNLKHLRACVISEPATCPELSYNGSKLSSDSFNYNDYKTTLSDGLCMKFKIGNLYTLGLLDTASDATIIGDHLAAHLFKTKTLFKPWHYPYGFKLPDHSILRPEGIFEVPLALGKEEIYFHVIYIKNFLYPAILGKNFLDKFRICIDYQKCEITTPFLPNFKLPLNFFYKRRDTISNNSVVATPTLSSTKIIKPSRVILTGGNREPLGKHTIPIKNVFIEPLKGYNVNINYVKPTEVGIPTSSPLVTFSNLSPLAPVFVDRSKLAASTLCNQSGPCPDSKEIQNESTNKRHKTNRKKTISPCTMRTDLSSLSLSPIVSSGPRESDRNFFDNLLPGQVETPETALGDTLAVEIPEIQQLLQDFKSIFSPDPGCTDVVTHAIHLEHERPLTQAPYRVGPEKREEISRQVEEMLEKGIIRKSNSQYASPVVLVEKKGSTDTNKIYRFCVDYRKLNNITIKDSYPLPRIDDSLEFLAKKKYFSVLDASAGYWQIKIHPADIHKTAFVTYNGLFEFIRMPFGLCNAPATFMRCMQSILHEFIYKNCVVYLDDIIVASATLEEHVSDLRSIFETIQKAGLTLNQKKCHFCVSEILYLGHLVSPEGIKPNPDKVLPIMQYPVPTTITELQRFLGMAGYYRKFIPSFATLAKPLTKLLQKDEGFIWSDSCQEAFDSIKHLLSTDPVLSYPDFEQPFILYTDSSEVGVGAVLSQGLLAKKNHPIAFASRTLNRSERNWSAAERETLAIIFGIEYFRSYLEGRKFTVVTDHNALCWLRSVKDPHGRLARWSLRLQNLDFDIIHRPGKYNQVADALSRSPLPSLDCSRHMHLSPLTSTPSRVLPPERLVLLRRSVNDPLDQVFENTQNLTLKELQEADPDIAYLLKLIKKDPTVKATNFYSENESKFIFINEILYLKIGNNNTLYPDRQYRLLLPRSLVIRVLQNFHDSPFGGHMGIAKTYGRIGARYRWPHMRRDVKKYVQSCSVCQLAKPSHAKPFGTMQSIQAVRPFQYLAMDFIGPLPRSRAGNQYAIVFVDLFTKWIECYPISKATGTLACDKLMDVVSHHGAPETVITDRGTQFTGHEFDDLLSSLGVSHHKCSIHHPEANMSERSIGTIKSLIRCYLEGRHNTWDTYLPEILFAIRSAPNASTGDSPAYLLYGRDLKFPLDYSLPIPDTPTPDNLDIFPNDLAGRLLILHKLANEKLNLAHASHSRYYDLQHRRPLFKVGDLVKVQDFILSSKSRGIATKLAPRYRGPYRISRQISENNFELVYLDSGAVFSVRHVQQMLPYFNRPRHLTPPKIQGENFFPGTSSDIPSRINDTFEEYLEDSSVPGNETFFKQIFGDTPTNEPDLSSRDSFLNPVPP